jgi:NAD(P)-dependent dehydrogenase (short-subunit alcohol dehydrogenase family)
MDLEIAGDVAVVVGGARGLGRAIAEAFAAERAELVLVDRDPEVVRLAETIVEGRTSRAKAVVADVTDPAAMRDLAGTVRKWFGRCDHLLFAAGVGSGKFGFPFWNLDPTDWERVLRINLIGAVNVAHAFAPGMAEARSGTLLFLASVAGQIGSQTDPPYSASKAGLINFAQCAARDLAPFGVRVNTLCPGMVRTALNQSVYEAWANRQPTEGRPTYNDWAAEKIGKLVPLGRWQEPEDIAAMAVFLASPRAGNVTGQTVNVDGGYVMHS